MRKIIPLLLMFVFIFAFIQESKAGIIDWDRKMGLRRVDGVVVSVDKRNSQITIKNRLNGKNASYQATTELLGGIEVDDRVLLKFKINTNIAQSIQKI